MEGEKSENESCKSAPHLDTSLKVTVRAVRTGYEYGVGFVFRLGPVQGLRKVGVQDVIRVSNYEIGVPRETLRNWYITFGNG